MPYGRCGMRNKANKGKNSNADITDIIDQINNIDKHRFTEENYDIILRDLAKASARLYFKSKQMFSKQKNQTSKTKYIPTSGKIIDEKDLDNMIDSSLDMWLTTGRFNDEFEKKLSEFLNVKYALTVNSGSSANLIALTALTSPKLNKKA